MIGPMNVGISVPTCNEGLSLPIPFCSPGQVVQLCQRAEARGFHSFIAGTIQPAFGASPAGATAGFQRHSEVEELRRGIEMLERECSRMYTHVQTLGGSTLRGQDLARMEAHNLVGSPEQIMERIAPLESAGVSMLAATSCTSNSYEEMLDVMELFAEEVLPVVAPAATIAR